LARSGVALVEAPQRSAFVQGNMSSLFAFDFVLRLVFARVMDVAFVIHVFGVHVHDFAADPASFRIPTHPIANFEPLSHGKSLRIESNARSRQQIELQATADVPKKRGCSPDSAATRTSCSGQRI
jgi:hypothetical protein